MTADPFRRAGWTTRRLGVVMTPDPGDPKEAMGVCNPACARGADGELYLFPRLVAAGNVSRVGRARVRFDGAQRPVGVERLGIALEPEAPWERHAGGGGVEDPRVTHVAALDRWVMTYTAWGPLDPRIALTRLRGHRLVALPERPWEAAKIGGGAPPLRIPEGWLVLHHGVAGRLAPGDAEQAAVRYTAGALLLDAADVTLAPLGGT